ncbi:O-methyltransferase [Dactylosporangium sp. NPDC050588]|uniref:O-methyltransferase n=1 Tax=Dactylosporangium sp. NPDC050588 TaxID=3157211 RepID=UPI0033E8EFAA
MTTGIQDTKHLLAGQDVGDYVAACTTPPGQAVTGLIARAGELGDEAGMMATAAQATLLTMLARLVPARLAVDIGTFTGLSALALAEGVGAGGRVVTCDVSDRWLPLAREHWEQAGVADRIDFRLGAAGRTLAGFEPGSVDLVFVDADKMSYPRYHALAVPLLRPGGLLVADNVLLDGWVVDPSRADTPAQRRCAETLRAFNAALAADERLDAVMLPLADGLTIARRR